MAPIAGSLARGFIDVYFIPVSPDGNIRLAFGQQHTSYTDTSGNVWWGASVPRGFNSFYENADGIGFTGLLGTWNSHSANWISGGTIDPQLYGMSTSAENDQNLTVVVPNATYNLTLYGEPGYGITAPGKSLYDVEINGVVAASYQDSWLLSGSQLYHGYTAPYTATVSNGLLQFNGRIREHEPSGYGFSLSSLLLSTGGGCTLQILTTSLTGWGVNVPYSQNLSATCGTLPYSWSLSAGSLPPGLTLSTSGTISGVPSTPGTFPFTVEVTDAASTHKFQPLSLTILGPVPPTASMGVNNMAILNGAVK
jgi:hypothetical protein